MNIKLVSAVGMSPIP